MEKRNSKSQVKTRLTMQDRLDILQCLDSGETVSSVANRYGVSASAIYKIKSNEENILINAQTITESHGSLKKKRAPAVEQSELDQALYSWFRQKRNRGEPISGRVLKEKALQLNEKLRGPSSFQATDGYIQRFKSRHGIHHISIQGTRLSADKEANDDFCSKFYDEFRAEYSLDQIYNANETGLWWKTLPRKTFVAYNESRADGCKMAKDRITLMVCANASGSHKLPLFAIGKSANPRCFKQIAKVPVRYTDQKSAWMDKQKFMEWYTEVFLPEIKEKHGDSDRKCILLLDNAPTHPSAEILNAVSNLCKVIYMPPNVTSLIQPMDQGVIEKFKRSYRRYFLREFLLHDNSESTVRQFLRDWDILKCLLYAAQAWESLTADNLRRAWKNLIPMQSAINNDVITEEIFGLCTFETLLRNSTHLQNVTTSETQEWLSEDSADHGWPLLTDEEILSPDDKTILDEDEDLDEPQNRNEAHVDDPKALEALLGFDKFQKWFQKRCDLTPEDWTKMFLFRDTAITAALNEKFPGRVIE